MKIEGKEESTRYSTEKGVIPMIPYLCMRYAHLRAYFIFIFILKKKNNLPTSKSCNLVKERKIVSPREPVCQFYVCCVTYRHIHTLHRYITPDRYIHLVYIHAIHTITVGT